MSPSAKDSQSSKSVAVNTMSASASSQGSSAVSTPPILELPVELLRMIFSHCNEDDDFRDTRPDVRLVCQDFELVVAPMLAQEWSGCLDLPLNKHSMDGLAGIRPIFASHLKAIRLCTQRLNKIGKIDCSDPELNRRRRQRLVDEQDWSFKEYKENLARLNERITSHNREAEEQQKYFMSGAALPNLLRALQKLRQCHDKSVSLGVYDLDWRTSCDFENELKHFGVDTAHITNDASSTLQILASAVSLSDYPGNSIELQLLGQRVQACNIEAKDIFWSKCKSVSGFSVRILPGFKCIQEDPEPIISVFQSDGWHLSMVDHCFNEIDDGVPLTCFHQANYGALYEHIRNRGFKTVTLRSIQARDDFLSSDLSLQSDRVESLEMYEVFFERHLNDRGRPAASLAFLPYLKSLRKLQNLTLEKISDDTVWPSYPVQTEKTQWAGQAEIQAGLDALIAKAKAELS
ncbi:hypothetical protein KCU78_g2417, partial [Aureobasidium melanogenum]